MPENSIGSQKVQSVINHFSTKLSVDLLKSVNDVVGNSPNISSLQFKPKITQIPGGYKIQVISNFDYWYYIENGRKKGKMPPSDKFGRDWQTKVGLNANKVMLEINAKSKGNTLKSKPKKLNYNKNVKTLAFLIARSIGKKGVKPKPFIDRVVNDGRMSQFSKDMAQALGQEIISDIIK